MSIPRGTGDGELEIVLKHLSVVRLEPGDTLVFRSPHALSWEKIRRFQESVGPVFPNHLAIVLDQGMELSIVRKEQP